MVSGGVRGTLPWMAPELLSSKSNMVTEKVKPIYQAMRKYELLFYLLKMYNVLNTFVG